jgi:hypothetical protein
MPRLITEWSTSDPGLADMLRSIAELPEHDPVRHEMEALLHTQQARFAWREADRLRELERKRRR